MIKTTINKINTNKLKNHKVYIIDKSLSYVLVTEIKNKRVHIITIMTDKGRFNIEGKNPIIKTVT